MAWPKSGRNEEERTVTKITSYLLAAAMSALAMPASTAAWASTTSPPLFADRNSARESPSTPDRILVVQTGRRGGASLPVPQGSSPKSGYTFGTTTGPAPTQGGTSTYTTAPLLKGRPKPRRCKSCPPIGGSQIN